MSAPDFEFRPAPTPERQRELAAKLEPIMDTPAGYSHAANLGLTLAPTVGKL